MSNSYVSLMNRSQLTNLSGDGSSSSNKENTLVQAQQSLDFRVVNLLEHFEHSRLPVLSVALQAHSLGLRGDLLLQTLDLSCLLQHFLHDLLPHSGNTQESRWFAPDDEKNV